MRQTLFDQIDVEPIRNGAGMISPAYQLKVNEVLERSTANKIAQARPSKSPKTWLISVGEGEGWVDVHKGFNDDNQLRNLAVQSRQLRFHPPPAQVGLVSKAAPLPKHLSPYLPDRRPRHAPGI